MRKVKINGIYKHFKGNYYIVTGIAFDTINNTDVVIYRALYDDNKLYVRDYNSFISLVDKSKYPNVKEKYRFKLVKLPNKKIDS